MKTRILLLSLFFGAISVFAKDGDKKVISQFGFIENKGQILDQEGKPNTAVKYLWTGNGLNMQLRANGFSYEVVKHETGSQFLPQSPFSGQQSMSERRKTISERNSKVFVHRVDVELVDANPSPLIIASDPATAPINYYTAGSGDEGVTGVRDYKKVLYKNIYPHIDLEFLMSDKAERRVKYNFIVHPGGDPNNIQLRYHGADKTRLTREGNLLVTTAYGEFSESIPLSYEQETGKHVSVHYSTESKDRYTFSLKTLDRSKTLVIDPWATYYGGTSNDLAQDIAIEATGNILVGGTTQSVSNVATSGSFQMSYAGNSDAFIVKLDNAGARVWATYFGTANFEGYSSICVDNGGDIILLGTTESVSGLATAGAYQTATSGSNNLGEVFLSKFNSSGVRLWSTYYGGPSYESARKVRTDAANNIFFTGITSSTTLIATPSANQVFYGGGEYDAFLVKFASSGTRLWSTYFGGNNPSASYKYDDVWDLTIDGSGNVLIAGETNSLSNIATPGAHQMSDPTPATGASSFLAKFNSSGGILWGTYYGGYALDIGYAVACDISDNVYLAGHTNSSTNIATPGAFQTTNQTQDAYVVKFNAAGVRQWGTYFGGNSWEEGIDININPAGEILLGGNTASTSGLIVGTPYQASPGGDDDVFVLKMSSSGTPLWATYFGGNDYEMLLTLAAAPSGQIIIAGQTLSHGGIATSNAFQPTHGGGTVDCFIASYSNAGSLSPSSVANNIIGGWQAVCVGVGPPLLTGSVPSGGSGTYQYLWLQSNVNATTGFTVASGANNLQDYQPPALTQNTWYKRVVLSGSVTDTSASVQITVNSLPSATITPASPTSFCQGGSVQLDANTGAGLSYQWLLNGTAISGATNSSCSATASGDYTIAVANSNNCKDTSAATSVTVFGLPLATITAQGPTSFCQGENVELNANTGTGLTYQWLLNNTIVAGATNAAYTASLAGDYSVVVTNGNDCSDTSTVATIIVNPLPFAPLSPGGPVNICPGNTAILHTSPGPGLNYQWLLNNVPIPGATDDTLITGQAGLYSVVVTNASNCADTSMAVFINVFQLPPAFITFAGNDTVCQGDTVLLEGPPIVGLLYQWQINGADISGATDANYAATVSGNYTVVVQSGCDSTSVPLLITVLPSPVPQISHTGMTLSTGSFDSYQWSLNGNPIPGATNQVLSLSANGIYSVSVTDGNGCEGRSADMIITDVAVWDLAGNQVEVFPNPCPGLLTIRSTKEMRGSLSLMDAAGRVLHTETLNSRIISIDLSGYSAGIYLLRFEDAYGNAARSFKVIRD